MTVWGRGIRCAAAVAGATALLAGCGSSGGGGNATAAASSTAPATPSLAAASPTGFDGCHLPQSVINEEHINTDHPMSGDNTSPPNFVWRGCIYGTYDGDGFSVNVRTTNLTISTIEQVSNYKIADHTTIAGRQAVTYHTTNDSNVQEDCILNVEMKGGGLELLVDNPPSNKATGTQNACDIAKRIGGELVATFPSSI